MTDTTENTPQEEIPSEPIDPQLADLPEDEDELAESHKEDTRFQEGELLRFVRVRFPGNNRSFPFLIGKRHFQYGQKVVAMSDRGMAVGYINSFPYEIPFHKGLLPIRSIAKIATDEDLREDEETHRREKRAEIMCSKYIERHQLDMQLTHVEFTQYGKKAVFYFTSPSRVDFRGLVHDLVGELKMRIELRQISVRDRAAAVGGIGPCGRELCCSSFLVKYGHVGIKLAKNQDLSLNSSKTNGVCGQLKCCLQYEDEVYAEKRKRLPREGEFIRTKDDNIGRVERLHLLSEQFEMINPAGVRKRYVAEMFVEKIDPLDMPRRFEHVSDETKNVLGLIMLGEIQQKRQVQEQQEIKTQSKDFADQTFGQLFGATTFDWALPEVAEPQSVGVRKLSVEEEEEIVYVPSEDEILSDDEDDDDFEDNEEEVVTMDSATPQREERPRQQNQPQRNNQQRHDQRPRQQHNQQQGQGSRSPQQRNDQQRHDQRPQNNQQGPRPAREGGPNQQADGSRSNNNRRRRHRGGNRGGGNRQGGNGPSQPS